LRALEEPYRRREFMEKKKGVLVEQLDRGE
jgi:hypothetical protein